jgi:ATP-dependent protease ClpP protease subunit
MGKKTHPLMWAREQDASSFMAAKPKRRNSEDDEMMDDMVDPTLPPKPFQVYESYRQQQITTYYLTDVIGDPKHYVEIVHRMRTAQPQDVIYIHLNTPGGRLDTGIQIINAMKSCEARIVAVLDSKAHSLGTLLFLAADEFVVHDDCMFMIHNFSSTIGGKGNEQESELLATLGWFKKLANKYYVPFLTPAELERVLDGKDMWMDSDEVRKRLKRMVFINEGGKAEDYDKKNRGRSRKPKVVAQEVTTVEPTGVTETGILPAATTIVKHKKSPQ